MPRASQKQPSGGKHGRDSQEQARYQKSHKPSKFADEGAIEYLVTNRISVPHEHVLAMPQVIDLDQPSTSVQIGFVGSHEMRILEAWLLRPSDPIPGQLRTWRRARRIFMPFNAEELEAEGPRNLIKRPKSDIQSPFGQSFVHSLLTNNSTSSVCWI